MACEPDTAVSGSGAGAGAGASSDSDSLALSLSDYKEYICCGSDVRVFLGSTVAVIVDTTCAGAMEAVTLHPDAVFTFVNNIDRMLAVFSDVVGKTPPVLDPFRGRVRLEVSSCRGAAGLAHHGRAGICSGPAFLKACVERTAAGTPTVHHVYTYEFMRNYIFPDEFTPVFDYHTRQGKDCWGWVNQGFVNVAGLLMLSELPDITFDYHGQDADTFMGGMVKRLTEYVESGLAWEDVFMEQLLPWASHSSLDNVYSGLLVTLWRRHGKGVFLRRWFQKATPVLLSRTPKDKSDVVTARDNFFLGACIAANADLRDEFKEWRWPLSDAVVGADGVLDTALLAAAV